MFPTQKWTKSSAFLYLLNDDVKTFAGDVWRGLRHVAIGKGTEGVVIGQVLEHPALPQALFQGDCN
jgi:hypothetical protein